MRKKLCTTKLYYGFIMKEKSWFKPKVYLHFTTQIEQKDKKLVEMLVTNPKKVAKHAFFPLLYRPITQRRYKKVINNEGKEIRSHKETKDGITKSTKKIRPILYATHIDAHIYSYYTELLQRKYETLLATQPQLSDCVLAYRRIPVNDGTDRNKNNIDFAKETFDYIKQRGNCVAIAFDVESFFNNLNHKLLKQAWTKLLGQTSLPSDHYNIYKSITDYSFVSLNSFRKNYKLFKNKQLGFDEKDLAKLRNKGIRSFFETPLHFREAIANKEIRVHKNLGKGNIKNGIPQGLPISAIMANLYMYEFDKQMFAEITEKYKGLYRRYSDDIVVVCGIEEYEKIKQFTENLIQEFKLNIAKNKTEVCIFKELQTDKHNYLQVFCLKNGEEKTDVPFVYLGFEFYGYKTLIKSANLAKFYRRMITAIKRKKNRIKLLQKKLAIDTTLPIFKRRLIRIYTFSGHKKRKVKRKRTNFIRNEYGFWVHKTKITEPTYMGNFFTYAKKASTIMEEPAILRQLKNHKKIFRKAITL